MVLIQGNDAFLPQEQRRQKSEQERLSYWIKQLEPCQPASLLYDKPRPATESGDVEAESIAITGPLFESLRRYCERHRVLFSTVLLAAMGAVHYRMTGVEDAAIGLLTDDGEEVQITNSNTSADLRCIRMMIQNDSFDKLVRQVHSNEATAAENSGVPFTAIVEGLNSRGRDMSKSPLVRMAVAVFSQCRDDKRISKDIKTEEARPTMEVAELDLELKLAESESGLNGSILFATESL